MYMSWKELIYRFVIDLFSMSPANATTTVHMRRPRCQCQGHRANATATVPMPATTTVPMLLPKYCKKHRTPDMENVRSNWH